MSAEQPSPFGDRDWMLNTNIKVLLETDKTWDDFPPAFQHLTREAIEEMVRAPPQSIFSQAKFLDNKNTPYLKYMREEKGGLMNLYLNMKDYFMDKYLFGSMDLNEHAPYNLLKILTAERLIGSRIADLVGWDSYTKFGTYAYHAHNAMNLCKNVVKKLSS